MKWIVRIVLVALAVSSIAVLFAWWDYRAPSKTTQETRIIFKRGEGFRELINTLGAADIVRHPYVFAATAVVTGAAKQLKAGEYTFPAGSTPQTVLAKLTKGEVVVHKITIPEGLRVAEIVALLYNEGMLEGNVPPLIPEGSLLPETYYYVYGDTRAEMIVRMQKAMQEILAQAWKTRAIDIPLATPEEALVLASIVEKETGVSSERARVAAVFINRLRRGMRLQSDPTTVYGIEIVKGAMDRSLTTEDLKTPTPYNTYTIEGLPPTPIACAGKAAIEATLNPLQTNELFFVATGTGGHNFAENLRQHNDNVARYRATLKLAQ